MSNIILTRSMESEIVIPRVGFQGWLKVELLDAKTGAVKRTLEMPNLITDAGLNLIGSGSGAQLISVLNNFFGCGTGSTPPANSDTQLETEVAPASSNRSSANGGIGDTWGYSSTPPDYVWLRRVRLFVEAQANGNLTEIASFASNSGGAPFFRQLFKDGLGNPTTIVKTSADQLRVTWELRVYPPANDWLTPTVSISGDDYDLTFRPGGVGANLHWGSIGLLAAAGTQTFWSTGAASATAAETDVLGDRTTNIPNTTSPSSHTVAAYSAGNFYRDVTHTWEPSIANFTTGIGRVGTGVNMSAGGTGAMLFQVKFDPKIPKDNTKRLILTFRPSWARV